LKKYEEIGIQIRKLAKRVFSMKKIIFAFFLTCATLQLNAATGNFESGLQFLNQKNYKRAIDAFDLALKESPRNAVIWERRGYAYFCEKDYYQAINDYTIAITLIPNNPRFRVQRGLAYLESGNQNAMKNDLIHAARLGDINAQQILDKHSVPWKE
jgi:tetratricopeptide (TPR) repeat protein